MSDTIPGPRPLHMPVISIPLRATYDRETKELEVEYSGFASPGLPQLAIPMTVRLRFDPQASRALADLIHQLERETGGPIGEPATPHSAQ